MLTCPKFLSYGPDLSPRLEFLSPIYLPYFYYVNGVLELQVQVLNQYHNLHSSMNHLCFQKVLFLNEIIVNSTIQTFVGITDNCPKHTFKSSQLLSP